jgi:hypothetical protein
MGDRTHDFDDIPSFLVGAGTIIMIGEQILVG